MTGVETPRGSNLVQGPGGATTFGGKIAGSDMESICSKDTTYLILYIYISQSVGPLDYEEKHAFWRHEDQ